MLQPCSNRGSLLASLTVVDDDQDIRELLTTYLQRNGFDVIAHETGEALLDSEFEATDLLILDIGLPGIDGLELCRVLREKSRLPIIMLTAANDDIDRILGLELGADDYIGKPFNPRELLARVRALLRRAGVADVGPEARGGLQVDVARRTVNYGDTSIELTGAEFDLLVVLDESRGQIVSRDALYLQLKGHRASPFDRSIDTQVSRLRSKLAREVGYDPIKAIRGKGYQLVLE